MACVKLAAPLAGVLDAQSIQHGRGLWDRIAGRRCGSRRRAHGAEAIMAPAPHHVVIVGAGFGGLSAAQELSGAAVRITIIDQRNHHLFQPLLYQVATAALATSEIAWPIRFLMRKRGEVTTLLGDGRRGRHRQSPRQPAGWRQRELRHPGSRHGCAPRLFWA